MKIFKIKINSVYLILNSNRTRTIVILTSSRAKLVIEFRRLRQEYWEFPSDLGCILDLASRLISKPHSASEHGIKVVAALSEGGLPSFLSYILIYLLTEINKRNDWSHTS